MTAGPQQIPSPPRASRRQWLGLAVLVLPTLLLALDMTVLHLAVPHLSADLKPTSNQLLWILDIYGFMIASCLITMGTLGDRIGRRRLLLTGAVAFAAASVAAAFSHTAEALILTRALLGVAGATLMPSTLSLIRNMFHVDSERTLAITVWMTGFIVGSAIGPLVGGAMLEYFWWGSVFLLAVPVMVILLVCGPLLLPEFRDPKAGRLDIGSALLCIFALLLVIYGLKTLARTGPDAIALLALAIGLGTGTLFVRRQRLLADPMLELTLFSNQTFSTSVGALSLSIMAMSGAWLMVFQYLQGVLGMTPLNAGLAMLPATLAQILAAALVPPLARRLRPSIFAGTGLLMSAPGFVLIGIGATANSFVIFILGTLVMSIAMMPMMILGTDLVISSAPPAKAGAASAISETASELGMALGVAIIGSIGNSVYRRDVLQTLPANLPEEWRAVATETLGGAIASAAQLPEALASPLLASARQAFTKAVQVNALIGAAIAVVTAMIVWRYLRRVDPQSVAPTQP
ncbi:MAG: MFS transporter [Porticoccaceae bacterium]